MRKFVYLAIRIYKELRGVEDRARSVRPLCVRTKAAIKTVRERIHRNHLWKENSLCRELNKSPRSMSRLIRDDLHMTAYRKSKRHVFTPAMKEIRQTRTERLLKWHARTGTKTSSSRTRKSSPTRSRYNCQNDKICAQVSREAKKKVPRMQRGHHVLMSWFGRSCPIRG